MRELMSVFITFVGALDDKPLKDKQIVGIHLC